MLYIDIKIHDIYVCVMHNKCKWRPPYMVTMQMLKFDWSKPIFLHYFINISHRALQKDSLESLSIIQYFKLSAILDFIKPRGLNAAIWLVETHFLHNFINIPHRALQNGSLESLSTILYSKLSAILDFIKPRGLNAAIWLVETYFCS